MQKGSCHCGAVQFTVQGEVEQAIECNCSHCARKGFLLWFAPREALSLQSGEEQLKTYQFNQHVIAHRFCSVCGCQPFGLGRGPDGQEMAAVNLRCIEGLELEKIQRVQVDGRSV